MRAYLMVAVGAGLGGVSRYWLTNAAHSFLPPSFPYGTLIVNVLGSFFLGLFVYFLEMELMVRPEIRMLFTIGFCGALTTFSTFSYETFRLLRDAEYLVASMNVFLNVFVTILAIFAAFYVGQTITGG